MATPWASSYRVAPVGVPPAPPAPPPSPSAYYWPPLGTVEDVGLNTVMDIDPGRGKSREGDWDSQGFAYLYSSWQGSAWSGRKAWNTGNGHADGAFIDVEEWDSKTRLHRIVKHRTPWSYGPDGYTSDRDTGWQYANKAGTELMIGQPGASHFYAYLIWLPEQALPGGLGEGFLYTPGRTALSVSAQAGTLTPHALPIGSEDWFIPGEKWKALPSHSAALHDSIRNRVFSYSNGNSSRKYWCQLETGKTFEEDWLGVLPAAPGKTREQAGVFQAAGCCAWHAKDMDLYLAIRYGHDGKFYFCVTDPGNVDGTGIRQVISSAQYTYQGAPLLYNLVIEGEPPPVNGRHYAVNFSQKWGCIIALPTEGSPFAYFLVPSSDPRHNPTWTWVKKDVSGPLLRADGAPTTGAYNRVLPIEEAQGETSGLFDWLADVTKPTQRLHLPRP